MVATRDVFTDALMRGMKREPLITVAEWADQHRILASTSAAEAGRWRTLRTPYLREIMELLSPGNPWRRIVVQAGAQVGKTECGNNWIGYVIHHSPGPMLMVQPTVDAAKRVSKQRIAPMIESTPALRQRVAEARERDSGNTLMLKEFEGGVLIIVGANASSGLRSMPIRFLFMDEVDEYPGDLDGQGDPADLAEARTRTFLNRKILMTSTPTIRGLSRIEREFLVSDQRRFYIPCPKCGHSDYLTWSDVAHHHIEWDEGDAASARMVCGAKCGRRATEDEKIAMLEAGVWAPTAPGDGRTAGFHLSALYSAVGMTWADCVSEFLRSKKDPFKLKTWVNTVLAETWEEKGDSVRAGTLKARLERYAAEVPMGVGVLVASVDVQGDRLEVVVKGYGVGEESWLIAFTQIHGDPIADAPWFELDKFLGQDFKHESGQTMRIQRTLVDSGGHHTEVVYRYCWTRERLGVYACKGGSVAGLPLVSRPSMNNRYRTPLFVLCADTGKDVVISRLMIREPGPGYIHLPEWVDDEYLEQLTAEKAIRKYVKGRGAVREWVKLRTRNEALDLEYYALGALYVLGARFVSDMEKHVEGAQRKPEPSKAPEPAFPPRSLVRRPSRWIRRGFKP